MNVRSKGGNFHFVSTVSLSICLGERYWKYSKADALKCAYSGDGQWCSLYIPAKRRRYSIVNQEMQIASMRASFGLSIGSLLMLRCWMEEIVFIVIPMVEATTNAMDITEMIWKEIIYSCSIWQFWRSGLWKKLHSLSYWLVEETTNAMDITEMIWN